MKNGHATEPSPFAYLAERGNAPYSADTLRFAEDVEKVQRPSRTGFWTYSMMMSASGWLGKLFDTQDRGTRWKSISNVLTGLARKSRPG